MTMMRVALCGVVLTPKQKGERRRHLDPESAYIRRVVAQETQAAPTQGSIRQHRSVLRTDSQEGTQVEYPSS